MLSERRRIQLAKSRDRHPTHIFIGVREPCDERGRVLIERRRIQLAKSRDRRQTHMRIGVVEHGDDLGNVICRQNTQRAGCIRPACSVAVAHKRHERLDAARVPDRRRDAIVS